MSHRHGPDHRVNRQVHLWPPLEANKSRDSDFESIPSSPSTGDIWTEEYVYCFVCFAAATALIILLAVYDGQLEPTFSGGLNLDTVVIAIMTVYRVALSELVESCLSQGAWIWVSGFRKGKREAKLEDFKMHLACVGAAITILIHGFETFSTELVEYDAHPTVMADLGGTNLPTPPPPRAESWHNIVTSSFGGKSKDTNLSLSTKAAIYDGIIASSISDIPIACDTSNCTWPIYPSLAVCGDCVDSKYTTACDDQGNCNYSTPSGTNIYIPPSGNDYEYFFKVASVDDTSGFSNTNSQAIFSVFDLLSTARSPSRTVVQANQCGLWFCLQSYNVLVTNGVTNKTVVAEWDKSGFAAESTGLYDVFVFEDIPPDLNAGNDTVYFVPADSLAALTAFMGKLMTGSASQVAGATSYDSDWIEAMEDATQDLQSWISRLTHSMSNNVQLTGTVSPANKFAYNGTTYYLAPHVNVHWSWIAYPLTLMVAAILYLMQTVWRTAHDRVCAWKNDSLPMLFCHIADDIRAHVENGMDIPEGLKERVGNIEVELTRNDEGEWKFDVPTRS
ncbi:hypothetical protein F5Y16DRAFT_408047 [Xylariaceae sp. FL0255]|nr:hypothetical protein F5Y16DRAFT_408047 [Xylariaceae sp. FL0255]